MNYAAQTTDPATFEIIKNSLYKIAEEMRVVLAKTAYSPLLKSAFVLREVQGYSTGEAAKTLGVTENTLKARLWRARHQLAERLGSRLKRMKDGMSGGMGGAECSYC